MLRTAGVSEAFLEMLMRKGFVTRPGSLWVSGYELVHRYNAGLITSLLDPWQSEEPAYPSSR
jgi:hypothetical protein